MTKVPVVVLLAATTRKLLTVPVAATTDPASAALPSSLSPNMGMNLPAPMLASEPPPMICWLVPLGPDGPVAPVAPVVPVLPCGPLGPVAPVSPPSARKFQSGLLAGVVLVHPDGFTQM